MSKDKQYRICLRHMGKNDNTFLFWCENSSGYTRALENAGKYEEGSDNDPIISYRIVEEYKQKIILPTYGKRIEKYGELNEFYVLPNTGQVRRALGITISDIELNGDRNSFDAYFKDSCIEEFKIIKSKTHFHVKAKNNVSEYWYLDEEFEAENRNQAILQAFNIWMPSGYDNYIDFKKDVTCKRSEKVVFSHWRIL